MILYNYKINSDILIEILAPMEKIGLDNLKLFDNFLHRRISPKIAIFYGFVNTQNSVKQAINSLK